MSMAIAMTVLDGAVLVADGCIQRPLGDKNLIQDDVDKIEPLTDSIFAIRFGIEHIAASAIEALRVKLAANKNCRPKALFASLESHLGNEWQSFLSRLPASVDPDNDALGVGVLCGGLAGGVPFLAGAVHHVIEPNPLLIFGEGPGRICVIGFQDEDEQEQFYQDIEQILPNVPWEPYEGPLNSCVERLLATSGAAIRSVESQTADAGGTIRFAVVRKGFPAVKEIWSGAVKMRTDKDLSDLADTITSGTMTAVKYRTAASGARIEIGNTTYPNEISGYNAAGGLSLLIGPQSVQTDYGYFDHIGHTAGVCQLIDGQVTGRFSYSGATVYGSATKGTAWENLNLSSYVGARRALVLLRVYSAAGGNRTYRFRIDGTSVEQETYADNFPGAFSCRCSTSKRYNYVWTLTGTNGYLEWCVDVAAGTTLVLLAYIN